MKTSRWDSEDRWIGNVLNCAIESKTNRVTIQEACRALGCDLPVSEADLKALIEACTRWNIVTNVSDEAWWKS